MPSNRTHRRALTAFTVAFSAALASLASLGCSSDGSGFGPGTGGSGNTNPAGSTGGDAVTDPTNTAGGSTSNPTGNTAGSNTNPTGNMGGSTSNPTGNMGGSTATTGGDAPQGGSAPQAGSGNTGGTDAGPVCPKPAGEICHEFLANDNNRNVVNYINEFTSTKPGAVVWSTNVGSTGANSPRTIEIVDNAKATKGKAILVSINNGYVEIDRETGAKLSTTTVQFSNVTGACRLPDGTTALGTDTNPSQIHIVNASGVQSRTFNLPAGQNLRAINRDPATGHFWLSRTEVVYELNDQGQILWQANMGANTKGYAVWWRQGGGAYATTGEPHTIVEIDGTGKIAQTIGGDDASFTALKLDFFSGFVRLPSGNYIVANWLGHNGSPAADTPEILEFQPNGAAGKVIWQWGNQTLARQITNVYVFR